MSNAIWRLSWVLLLVLLFIVTAHGAVIVPPQAQDDLNLQVTETVTFDANSGLYTYEYSIKSRKTADRASGYSRSTLSARSRMCHLLLGGGRTFQRSFLLADANSNGRLEAEQQRVRILSRLERP